MRGGSFVKNNKIRTSCLSAWRTNLLFWVSSSTIDLLDDTPEITHPTPIHQPSIHANKYIYIKINPTDKQQIPYPLTYTNTIPFPSLQYNYPIPNPLAHIPQETPSLSSACENDIEPLGLRTKKMMLLSYQSFPCELLHGKIYGSRYVYCD